MLRVTPSDMVLMRPGARTPIFSYAAWARAAFDRDLAAAKDDDAGMPLTIREIDVKPLSWLGNVISFSETTYTSIPDHEAHPAGESRLVTLLIDENAPSPGNAKPLSLTDYFDESAIYEALRREEHVKRQLSPGDMPADLSELVRALADRAPAIGGPCYSFPEDLLTRFAFEGMNGGVVRVDVGLPGTAICREELTELALSLPAPARLNAALRSATVGPAGFVAANRPAKLPSVHLRMTSDTRP